MVRMSADERRESVIRAAMHEFARGGYYGTSTDAIAKRVGVSQPYLFRLFPNKQAIFLAASERCLKDTREVFADAAEGLHGEEALHAMAAAYTRLIAEDPDKLQMQLQVYVTVAAAEAAGDHAFGEVVRGRLDGALGCRAPAAGGRREGDHDLHGVRDADQHPCRHGVPARTPGLGGSLPVGPRPGPPGEVRMRAICPRILMTTQVSQ